MTVAHPVPSSGAPFRAPDPPAAAPHDHPPALRFAFRSDIEGLRGVAVLFVVAFHARVPGFGGGFVGVDMFFTLSGYLITGLLLGELTRTGTIGIAAFYARRMRRLLPAAAVVIVAALLLATLAYPPLRVAASAEAAQAAAVFVSNVFFSARTTDYFDGLETNLLLLHTWSLSVEEQFYLAWPWLVLLLARRGARRGLGWTLVVLAGASLAASWWWTIARRPTAFYGTPTRAWEFAAGAMIALLPLGDWTARRAGRAAAAALGWLGLALISGAALRFSERTSFPGLLALIPVGGTALVLASAADARGAVGRALSTPALQWIGRHSYAWYLWHWPLLVLGAVVVPDAGLPVRMALVLLGLALAAATRALVEEPCRRAPVLLDRPRLTVAAGVLGIAALFAGAAALRHIAIDAADSPALRAFSAAPKDLPRLYRDHCSNRVLDDPVARMCEYDVPGAGASVLVFGDSHAAHWVPALEVIARERRWRLLVITKSACPSVDVPFYHPYLQRIFRECSAWRRAALDTIRARRPTLVVVSNSTEYVLDGPRHQPEASVTPQQWERGLERTLAALQAAGVPTVVIRDTPSASENVPACLTLAAWRGREMRRCDFPLAGAVHEAAAQAERRAVAAFPGHHLLDLTAAVCPDGRCPAVREGVVAYRDARHLTASASAALASALAAALDRVPLSPGAR